MDLPDLPKQNEHKEADFGILLKHHTEKTRPNTASFETKDTRGKDRFLFSELTDKQIAYANLISSDKGVWIRVQGTDGQPDYIWLRNEPAYIVIRYPKFFCLITIGNLLHEKETSKKKSLSIERAREIASIIGILA